MKVRISPEVITLSLFLLVGPGCSPPLIYKSIRQDKPVIVDGKATEWKIPLDYYDDKTKLNFTVTNDDKNLYLCIRATEPETQRGIIHTGLQIWIDTSGGKKSQVGIQFPIIEKSAALSGSEASKHSEPQDQMSVAKNLKSYYAGVIKQLRLTGFTNATNGIAEVPNIYGINTCLNWDTNNIMIYEACIPFNTFYKTALSPSDSNKVFGISLVVTVASKNGGGGGVHAGGMAGSEAMGEMAGNDADIGNNGEMGGGMHGGAGHGGHHSDGGSSGAETLTAHIELRLAVAPSLK